MVLANTIATTHKEKVKELAMSLSYKYDMDRNANNTNKWEVTNFRDFTEEAERLLEENPDKYRDIDDLINVLQPLRLSSAGDKDIALRMQVAIMHTG